MVYAVALCVPCGIKQNLAAIHALNNTLEILGVCAPWKFYFQYTNLYSNVNK